MMLPGSRLTVVIRDDSPLILAGDGPSYRSVGIQLTDDQREQLALKKTGTNCGKPIFESISKVFIEPEQPTP